MFDNFGFAGASGGAGASWGDPSLPEPINYGLVLPSVTVVKTPDEMFTLAGDFMAAVKQESNHYKPLSGNRIRIERRAGGALTVEEAAYSLQRMVSFAHSRNAPKTAEYLATVKVDSNYPNGASSQFRYDNGSPRNANNAQYFDYQNVNWQEWTTGKRKDASVGRVRSQDVSEVERDESGVPVLLTGSAPAVSQDPVIAQGQTDIVPKARFAAIKGKIKNHLYKPDQPIYKQPYLYYSIGIGVLGFFVWYMNQED